MRKTLKEIAALIRGEIVGDSNTLITGISGIKEAREGDITFLANPKYTGFLKETRASAIITSRDIKSAPKPIIRTDNPSLAFAQVMADLLPTAVKRPRGVHPTAILSETASLGKDVAVGPYVVIGDNVSVGDRTVIYSFCYIASGTTIGKDGLIYPNVSLRENVVIGNRVVIQSGAVIGSDGFGFVTIDDKHCRIPQIGAVIIEDDVEIGANVTIDRARFDKTIIGQGTKIDNLVQIAHNVVVGKNCFIVAQAGISGSTSIGNNVTLAGQAGLAGHLNVGDGSTVAAQAGVTKSIPPDTIVSGYPAKPHHIAKQINACVQNLPRLYRALAELKKKVAELESKLKNR